MGVEEFTEEMLVNPNVIAMIDRIDVVDDPSLYERVGRESVPGKVSITTNSGAKFSEEVLYPKGHPRNAMNRKELKEKFDMLTEGALPRSVGNQLHDMVMNLEKVGDIGDCLKLCKTSN